MKLDNTISAIVAGGATGLGAAAAEKLASRGCKVAILDMYREPGEALAKKIGAIYCHLEISSEITVDTAIDFAREENGQERILVNCAGVALEQRAVWRDGQGRVMLHDDPSFERLLQVNLTGTFYMAVKSAAGMIRLPALDGTGSRGIIINSASVAAEDGLEGQAAYAASEGGVLALTRPLARDLLNDGVRVLTIMPGRFDTMMFTERSNDIRQAVGTTQQKPAGMSDPAEFADKVIELCENEQYNGQCIRLSGAKNA
jgi:NAD(P)-dependent dehydrogenase (short-subunit alcohol dehydrogenase family)